MAEALVRRDHEEHEDRLLETVLGPPLVARLYGLLRAVRIYDQSNQTVRDQLRQTLALVEEAMEDEVALVAMGQCFYVNGARVRAEPSQVPVFSALSAEFEQRRLGGMRFLEGLRAEELGAFMRLMVDHADAARGPQLGEAAASAGVVHVVPITLEELESAENQPGESNDPAGSSEHDRARRSYQQALRGTKAAILRTARTGRPAIRRAKRVVQPIVDSTMKNEFSIVGLTAIKNHDEYTYAHCVNVSILSIAIGQTLGFPRGALANLGVGALLHDVGKLSIPVDVLGKSGRLTDDEWNPASPGRGEGGHAHAGALRADARCAGRDPLPSPAQRRERLPHRRPHRAAAGDGPHRVGRRLLRRDDHPPLISRPAVHRA
jgi:HD-GYP domain-containing protein (c-di-GMP phosphodiesterase class II)